MNKKSLVTIVGFVVVAFLAWLAGGLYTARLSKNKGIVKELTFNSDARNIQYSARYLIFPPSDGYKITTIKLGQELPGWYLAAHYLFFGLDKPIGAASLRSNHVLFGLSVGIIFLCLRILLPGSLWAFASLLLVVNKDLLFWQSMAIGEPVFYLCITMLFLFTILILKDMYRFWPYLGFALFAVLLILARINGIIVVALASTLLAFQFAKRWVPSAGKRIGLMLGCFALLAIIPLTIKPDRVFRELNYAKPYFYDQMVRDVLPPLTLPLDGDGIYYYDGGRSNFKRYISFVTEYPLEYLKIVAQRSMAFFYIFLDYRHPLLRAYLAVVLLIILLYLVEMPRPPTNLSDRAFLYSGLFVVGLFLFNAFVNVDYDFKYHAPAGYFLVVCLAIAGRNMIAPLAARLLGRAQKA